MSNIVKTRRLPTSEAEPDFSQESTPVVLSKQQKRESAVERLQLLWNQRRFLSHMALAGMLMGVLLAFLIPSRFDSSTQLMPPDNPSSSPMAMALMASAGGTGALGAVAGDLLGLQDSGALFIGILKSRTIQDRLVEKFDLRKVYGYRLQEDARRRLFENTSIGEDRKSGIISITVTDRDPHRATALAQEYVDQLNRLVAELSTSAAHRERVFLEERLAAVKQSLDDASRQFSQFSSKNGAIDIKEQGRAMIDAAATLMGQMIAAQSELKGLEQIYTANNVRVHAVQARIGELRKQLRQLGGGEGGQSADAPGDNDSLYPSIRKLPLLGVTYADLYRQTKVQETVYEILTKEYELAKVQEARETPSVKVLDAAAVPERRSYPPRLQVIFVSMCIALMAAMLWILGKSHWDQVDDSHSGKLLALNVLQTVGDRMPWRSRNGSHRQSFSKWLRTPSRASDSPAGTTETSS